MPLLPRNASRWRSWGRRLQRLAFAVLVFPVAVAFVLTAVDSYRRRGKRPLPFATTPPGTVSVGDDPNSRVTTYTFGEDLFEDMLKAISGARQQVLIESYIWRSDETGQRFKSALLEAAERGVEVYAIYDGFANLFVNRSFRYFKPPMRVLRYPVYSAGLRFFDLRRYGRDHRKILVVDDDVAFIGGYNLGSPYLREWRDTHVRIEGPGVWDLKRTFADFWNLNQRSRKSPPLLLEAPSDWEPRIRVHRNVPRLWMFPIRSMYLEAIGRAQHHIYLTQAYLLPDENFLEALCAAAQRGVDVRIVVPRTSNHVVADWISRSIYDELLTSGVRIFRFTPAMVHAKTATIDGAWSTVGTANIDRLSMRGNYEVNVEFVDAAMATEMERIFAVDLGSCEELTAAVWERRGLASQLVERVLAPLRPLL